MEKPLTEAQRIIEQLKDAHGMTRAAIAQAIAVKSSLVRDIQRGASSGNLHVYKLRRLLNAIESPGNRGENRDASITPNFSDIVPDASPTLDHPDPASASLNAEEPEPPEKKGMFERVRAAMLGHATDPLSPPLSGPSMTAPQRSKGGEDRKGEFVDQVLPLASIGVSLAFLWLIHDPYKPMAPTQAEAALIITPILRRAARELDIRQRLTDDTMELMSLALALGLYGQRAYGTYKQIHEMEVERAGRDGHGNNAAPSFPAFSQPAAGAPADAGPRAGGEGGSLAQPGRPQESHRAATGGQGRATNGGSSQQSNGHATTSIAQLLQADAEGRRRLGL